MTTELEAFWVMAEHSPYFKPDHEVQNFIEAQMKGELVESVNIHKLKNMNTFSYWHAVRSIIGFVSPTLEWSRSLKKVVGDKRVIEVGAGTGLLASYFDAVGIDIKATDDFSWYDEKEVGSNWNQYFPVEKLDFKDAIKKYPADFLLLCWPVYESSLAKEAAELFTNLNPDGKILYIGEEHGGCTGNDEFHNGILEIELPEEVNTLYPQWSGLHDYVYLVKWGGCPNI